jgi:S1-C subfamily serine protease
MTTYEGYSGQSQTPHPASASPLSRWLPALVIILSLLLIVQAWMPWLLQWQGGGQDSNAAPRPVAARGDLAQDEQATIALFRDTSRSVVYITNMEVGHDAFFNVLEVPQGTGSGFIWDEQGHVVTNYHVLKGASRVKVTLADQSTWNASFVGGSPERDLAVVRITAPADRLRPVLVGESNDLQVGQKVFAIGNPFGLDQTLTTGIVSGLGRQLRTEEGMMEDLIQTDAAINPGNSGGPLLDSAGRLIGVNTAIYSPSGASAGVGFAIPVDNVNRIVPQLIKNGRVLQPGLGARYLPDQITRRLGLTGVMIAEVLPNSAASSAKLHGLRRDPDADIHLGDLIVAVDGKPVSTTQEFLKLLTHYDVGDKVKLTITRAPKSDQPENLEVEVTLQAAE